MLFTIKGTDLLHNGERYPEGSEIDLSEKEAKGLEAFLEPAASSQKSKKGGKE